MTTDDKLLTAMELRKILEILPHRYPFLLIDRVLEVDLEERTIVAQKNVTFNEGFFQGHFPEAPIMPGVMILEALAQAGAILVHEMGFKGRIAVLMSATSIKFRTPVRPGDVLILHGHALHVSKKGGKFRVKATVSEKMVAEAEVSFAFIDKEQI